MAPPVLEFCPRALCPVSHTPSTRPTRVPRSPNFPENLYYSCSAKDSPTGLDLLDKRPLSSFHCSKTPKSNWRRTVSPSPPSFTSTTEGSVPEVLGAHRRS